MGKKIKIAKQEKKGTKEKVWIVIALISMAVYIGWRLFFTIPDHNVYGWLATICGICLAVSETISMLEAFCQTGKKIRTGYAGCAFRLVSRCGYIDCNA